MAYLKITGAASTVVSYSSGSLTVQAGHGARFVHPTDGPPSPTQPLLLQAGPDADGLVATGYLTCTGLSGDVLTVTLRSGTVAEGATVAAGDEAALWDEADAAIAGKQDVLGAGAVSTSMLADSGVTTVKIAPNAVTFAKIQEAASAGVIGASAAGNYGPVSIGTGLSLTGGVLACTVPGTVTSVGLIVPSGLSVSGSPVTGSGTLTISTTLTGIVKGTGTGFVPAVPDTDFATVSLLTSGLAGKEPTIATGTTAQYIRGDKSLATFSINGTISFPSDGSLAVVSGSGSTADPYTLRTKRRRTVAWIVASSAAGSTGDAADVFYAPFDCRPVIARMWARTNPTSVITAQIKVAGSNYLGSSLSVAGGATGPSSATSGWVASTISSGAAIVPNWSAMPSDARGVVVEFEFMEV